MLKHYVEFIYPGSFCSDYDCREATSEELNGRVEIPNRSYGYRFFEREEQTTSEEVLRGERKNHGGWHFLGEEYSLERIKAEQSDKTTLISNMECNKWDRVVKCPQGFIQMDEKDVVLNKEDN